MGSRPIDYEVESIWHMAGARSSNSSRLHHARLGTVGEAVGAVIHLLSDYASGYRIRT